MRTQTLAIVFTDIKGYTAATSAQTHQQNARMLRRTERVIAPVVRAYSGRVVKSIGDAYMLVFHSPTEAVRCAMAIQDRLHMHNAAAGREGGIHISIAMNVGEVRVHRGDVFGEPVNIAARIESITPADEVYLSEAVYLTMNRSDLPSERVGDFELKGIPEPVTVFRVKRLHAGDEAAAGTSLLPFGGAQLDHWRRMRWLRRANVAVWLLVLLGIVGAAYLRYRPAADYSAVVGAAKAAVEDGRAVDALTLAKQVPLEAAQDRADARRVRRLAAAMLVQAGSLDLAADELQGLLTEDPRDAEALALHGVLLARRGKDPRAAVNAIATALQIKGALANRPDIAQAVVHGYRDAQGRRVAEQLVEVYLKQNAAAPLLAALNDTSLEYRARVAIALRLEKLGSAQDVDWVSLALEELKSTSCKARKNAIARLVAESDERAVGPLMKVAAANGCGSSQAKKAIDAILGK